MDTRMRLLTIVDYKEFYGIDRDQDDAVILISGIPSTTLLFYISFFSVNLYLNENSENAQSIQIELINNFLVKAGKDTIDKCKEVYDRMYKNGFAPVFLWPYSNLLFYDLIFSNYNTSPFRDLTNEEAKNAFDAYLLLNSATSNKIKIEDGSIKKASDNKVIEEIILPNFIYQKDYASSTDFTNQIARGEMFFQYLESSFKYSALVNEYYKTLNVPGYANMFKNLMMLFTGLKINTTEEPRKQLLILDEYKDIVNLQYLETLCINSSIENYKPDISFSIMRSKMLYKISSYRYYFLDVNFFMDQFYKAQVFAFNSFLKSKGIKSDFLSTKAKEFTEEIYLPKVMNACFPSLVRYFGDKAKIDDQEELSDFYLRDGNKIALCEFKDVLLNAAIKNNADKDLLFAELDKKFFENQNKAPKGVRQLINAIKHIDNKSIDFDATLPTGRLEIFPILIYTDFSFGAEGINKKYNAMFKEEIKNVAFKNLLIHDFTFINLNFFEIRIEYLQKGLLNLFDMLNKYHEHILEPDYELTPFEVFSKFYMNEMKVPDLETSEVNKHLFQRILNSL